MKANEASTGSRIRWTKESRTFEGIVLAEQYPASGMVRVLNDEGHTMLVGENQECEVVK